jgi:hypothetical protein
VKFPAIPLSTAALLAGVLIQLPVAAYSQPLQGMSKPGPQAGERVPDFGLKLSGKTEASVAGTKIPARYLDITTFPGNPAVAPGDRFSVVLDIQPHPNMHVYAPGAKGYQAISLSIEPNPLVRVLLLKYPASETYFFKVLNEHVPVFQKPFRLVQSLVLEDTLEARAVLSGKENVTVKGTLEYQTCDDNICFLPVSVPLAWTMTLRRPL